MIHRLVPTAVLLTVFAAPLLGFSWSKSLRVEFGGVSFPLLTVVLVAIWAAIGITIPFVRRRGTAKLGILIVPWLGWLTWAGFGMWRGGFSGGGIAYLIAWGMFPLLAYLFATRWPIGERDTAYWVGILGVLGVITIVAPRGMISVPANINLTALVMVPGFGMALYFAFERRSFAGGVVALLIFVAFIVAGRRSAIVACLTAGLLAFATLEARRKLRLTLVLPIVLVYLTVFVALFFEDFAAFLIDRASSLGLAYDATVDTSDTRRAVLTQQAIDVWKANPWLGVGHGRYLQHLQELGVDGFWLARPHNIVLISLAENGAPGALLLVTTLVLPAIFGWRRSQPGSLARYWALTYAACCVYLLGNDYVHSPGFWPVFAALISAAYVDPLDEHDDEEDDSPEDPTTAA